MYMTRRPAAPGLSKCDTRATPARAVFSRFPEDFLNLASTDIMAKDMRANGFRINVEPDIHLPDKYTRQA